MSNRGGTISTVTGKQVTILRKNTPAESDVNALADSSVDNLFRSHRRINAKADKIHHAEKLVRFQSACFAFSGGLRFVAV